MRRRQYAAHAHHTPRTQAHSAGTHSDGTHSAGTHSRCTQGDSGDAPGGRGGQPDGTCRGTQQHMTGPQIRFGRHLSGPVLRPGQRLSGPDFAARTAPVGPDSSCPGRKTTEQTMCMTDNVHDLFINTLRLSGPQTGPDSTCPGRNSTEQTMCMIYGWGPQAGVKRANAFAMLSV